MSRCARSIGGIRKMNWASRKWKLCSRRSTAGTPTLNLMLDGIVFGLDRDGKPHHGSQVNGFAELKSDGSTACGCWIYSGVLGRDGVNKANSRKSRDYLGHGWGFAWPSDRRIIYNRASARPDGRPWSERKKLVWWDSEKWTGIDVAGFVKGKSPDYRAGGRRRRTRCNSG